MPRGIRGADGHGERAQPDAAVPRAGADDVQLRRAVVPQHRVAAVRGRRQRHLAAVHHRRDAAGPEQRGRPVVRARRTARTSRTTCTRTRIRTPPSPGQPRECEAANETYIQGRTVTSNVPGNAAGRDGGEPLMARSPPPRRPQPVRRRADRDRRDPDPHVPRLHEGHPVHAPVRGQRGLPVLERRAARTRPCGSPASRSARSSASRRQDGTDNAVVTMSIKDHGLPIHEDATAKIRPRIFLEGNFFVDLQPGTPGAPRARRRRHDQGHADRDAGPARPGADRAAVRHAPGPARRARGPRHRAQLRAERRRRPRRRPVGARRDRGRVVQRRLRRHRARRARPVAGQRGVPRASSPSRTSGG